jgi:hypothetical protein
VRRLVFVNRAARLSRLSLAPDLPVRPLMREVIVLWMKSCGKSTPGAPRAKKKVCVC